MVNPNEPSLPPLPRLLLAYAPAPARPWHALCWSLDQRLAAIVRRQGDPTITAIRLAWWDAVLVEQDPTKGTGEPLVEQWRDLADAQAAASAAEALIDGWRVLAAPEVLTEQDLKDYAVARGGGMFTLLSAKGSGVKDGLTQQQGAIWALWDLAGHLQDGDLAARAMKVAQDMMLQIGEAKPARGASRPLRLLYAVAARDVKAGRVPIGGFTLRHYTGLLIDGLRR